MSKRKKYIIRGIISFIAIVLVSLCVFYTYLTKSIYWKIDKKDREKIVLTIKSAQPLPDRFYYIYNKVYTGALDNGQLTYFLKKGNENNKCPCRYAAWHSSFSLNNINLISLTFWLEDQVSQKECLNFHLANVDLLHNIIGVFQASEYYFDKKIENLSDREFIELIIMTENPSFYNKRNKNRAEKVNDILNRTKL